MTRHERAPVPSGRRISARQIVALVVAALTVIFILQNRDPVEIRLFTLTVTASLWLLLIIMVGLGVVIGMLLARRR
jgi:uncharacterized integral membrane protein